MSPSTITTHNLTLTDVLAHLVRMPTVSSDHATNRAALDWVEEQLHNLPLNVKRFERNNVSSLIATTAAVKDGKNPRLWLAAHIDVVPANPEQFEPKIVDGRLYGRGTCDMKFAAATYIQLLKELGPQLSNYSLGLMLTTDEETTAGADGTKWLVEQGYRGEAVLLPDNGADWELEIGSKGTFIWKLTSHGRAAHGSRIWNGTNAVDQLYRFIEVLRRNTVTEPCNSPRHMHSTLNVGSFHGGTVGNQVPAMAEALIDIRVTPGITSTDVAGWMTKAQAEVPGVEAKTMMSLDSFVVPNDGPVDLFAELAQAATGRDHIARTLSPAGSEALYFAQHNVPVINIRPTAGDNHGEHEWIDIADLDRFYGVVREFTEQWAKVG